MKSWYSNDGYLNFKNCDPLEIIHFNTFSKLWPVVLDLTNCKLNDQHVPTLMNFISDNNWLTQLILNKNHLDIEFFGNLCTELYKNKSIKIIRLVGVKLNEYILDFLRLSVLNNIILDEIEFGEQEDE